MALFTTLRGEIHNSIQHKLQNSIEVDIVGIIVILNMSYITTRIVIWFSTGTLEIFATLVYDFIMRVVIYDILSMAIITTLSTSILFCNLYYIPL